MNERDERLSAYLASFVTDERRGRMESVLAERTRYLTVLLEDIYQPHNASAVLRSCDCFGIQDIHIVENRNEYRINPGVELGTAQWLTLHRYRAPKTDNTTAAIDALKAAGYRIVATTPHTNQANLETFDLDRGPIALLFGNELDGLSETALTCADEHLIIPMYGFVESFNISVSAAIVIHHLSHQMRSSGMDYTLSESERQEVRLAWLRSSVGRADAIERSFDQEESP